MTATPIALGLAAVAAVLWSALHRRRQSDSLPMLRGDDLSRVGEYLYGIRRKRWERDKPYRARLMAVRAQVFERAREKTR